MNLTKQELQNLSQLFLSPDDNNTRVAFEMMDDDLSTHLLTEIFAVYKLCEDPELKDKAKEILEKQGSSNLKAAMKWTLKLSDDGSLYGATEKTIAKNIDKYCDGKELIGTKMAEAMFKKFGIGSHYLLSKVPKSQIKENLQIFIDNRKFTLKDAALTKFPDELFEYDDLEEIDLTNNKIKTIPAKIQRFKNLKVLRMTGNNLKTINPGILKLNNLEELYLNHNLFEEYPELIHQISSLKKLDITAMTNINMYKGLEIPKSIQDLKNLHGIGIANYKDATLNWRFYSPYRNYPHLSWLETEKPLDLRPEQLARKANEVNGGAIAYIFRHLDDVELKKEILSKFYDKKTKTLDFDLNISQSLFKEAQYLENIPEEITSFDIETLNLGDTRIGTLASHFRTEDEDEDFEKFDAIRLAPITKLVQLKSLILKSNTLTNLPDLSKLTNLEYLDLSFNDLKCDLSSIGKLSNLKELNLYSAQDHWDEPPKIPDNFKNLKNLKKIYYHFFEMNEEEYLNRLKELLPDSCEILLDVE
ncbi:MAG: hypothetical protein MRY83_05255 [Flavobacteriales bacterium]|nr:hypothetical protein [Flavobacteriales bacterium]